MRKSLLLLMVLAVAACSETEPDGAAISDVAAPDCDEPIATQIGKLTGKLSRTKGTCEYLGVRYAKAPVGELRFAPPQSPEPFNGVNAAISYGHQCLQTYGFDQQGVKTDLLDVGSEDCLFLNVWRPQGDKLPVMLFIHGGAFTVGAGSWAIYEGDLLAQEGVIVVTINYRLGPLGFFAYPGLVTEGANGNQGILDQIQALTWVKENIAEFGGDPGNVTIFGESAGGMSVCTLLASPKAKGLFHAAILESGGCKATATLTDGYARAESYITDAGCAAAADKLACLRGMTGEDLIEKWQFDIVLAGLEPHVDGDVLTDNPLNVIREGKHNRVPLMSGANANEVQIVSLINPHSEKLKTAAWGDYYKALEATFGVTDATYLSEIYGQENFANPFDAWYMLKTDYILACPTFLASEAVGKQGEPSYHYVFSWNDLGPAGRATGTVHGLELFFVFGSVSGLQVAIPSDRFDEALAFSKQIRQLWANFAKNHVPSADGLPDWPEVAEGSMVLNTESAVDSKIKREACAFWDPRLPTGLENQARDLNALLENYEF